MTFVLRPIAVAMLLFSGFLAASSDAAAQEACTLDRLAGVYDGDYGAIDCRAEGDKLRCCYHDTSCLGELELELNVSATGLVGTWRDNAGNGPVEFGIDNSCSLASGLWAYEGNPLSRTWNITPRVADAEVIMPDWPADLQGTWTGEVHQPGSGHFPTVMILAEMQTDNVVGDIDYPSFGCGGPLTLVAYRGGAFILEERIERGVGNCIDGGRIQLVLQDDGVLAWTWFYPGGGLGASAGLVNDQSESSTQTAQDDAPADVGEPATDGALTTAGGSCTLDQLAGNYETHYGPIACHPEAGKLLCCYGTTCSHDMELGLDASANRLVGTWREGASTGPIIFAIDNSCSLASGLWAYEGYQPEASWGVTPRVAGAVVLESPLTDDESHDVDVIEQATQQEPEATEQTEEVQSADMGACMFEQDGDSAELAADSAALGTVIDNAVAAYDRGDVETALSGFRKAANAGHPSAQHALGVFYLDGVGVPENKECARFWFQKAPDHPGAQLLQGELYFLEGNIQEAIFWYSRAAEAGDADAQIRLGVIYAEGNGVPVNHQMAIDLFMQAAANGHQLAQPLLELQQKRAAMDEKIGQIEEVQSSDMGTCMFEQDGDSAELAADSEALRTVIDNAVAAYDRGDVETALSEFRKAANAGHPYAQFVLGAVYFDGVGVPENKECARFWVEKAPDHHGAQLLQGRLYHLEGNTQEAIFWFSRAAEAGNPDAQFRLGLIYADGDGVPVNRQMAIDLFAQAAANGHPMAPVYLENQQDLAAKDEEIE